MLAPRSISIFKINKNKQFNYTPVFYDKIKEERERRIKRIEKEMGVGDDKNYVHGITKGSIRNFAKLSTRKQNRNSTMRLVLITALLLILAYYLFNLS